MGELSRSTEIDFDRKRDRSRAVTIDFDRGHCRVLLRSTALTIVSTVQCSVDRDSSPTIALTIEVDGDRALYSALTIEVTYYHLLSKSIAREKE